MFNQSTQVALVTGASSGIGEAVASELLRRGWRVVGLSRRVASLEGPLYSHVRLDLANTAELAGRMDAEFDDIVADPTVNRLALVNNAADPGLLGTLDRVDPVEMLRVCAINVVAPAWLMGWLVRRSRAEVPLRIVNLSSGTAQAAFPGAGTYGYTKAALRMAGMVLASELEHPERPGGARPDASVVSYDPGVVDTPAQAALRSSSVETLPIVGMFKHLAAEGLLASPDGPAREIADYLDGDGHPRFVERSFGQTPTA